jgi:hypothetical protein
MEMFLMFGIIFVITDSRAELFALVICVLDYKVYWSFAGVNVVDKVLSSVMQHSPLIIIVVVMVASKEQPKYYEMHLLAGMLPTSLCYPLYQ